MVFPVCEQEDFVSGGLEEPVSVGPGLVYVPFDFRLAFPLYYRFERPVVQELVGRRDIGLQGVAPCIQVSGQHLPVGERGYIGGADGFSYLQDGRAFSRFEEFPRQEGRAEIRVQAACEMEEPAVLPVEVYGNYRTAASCNQFH